ncbi:MAG: DUF3124 domain-containing protein [Prolixibacteraceae bacterium]
MRNLLVLLSLLMFLSCTDKKTEKIKQRSHPSHVYTYSAIDTAKLNYFESDYVPVYSDIYFQDGTRRFHLTSTISLRNTSLQDSAYILSAKYYDSHGQTLKEYVDSTLLLLPLESIEFVVEDFELAGGVGANFIINWGAVNYSNQLLIQSIMIGTYGQQGVSFLSESKVIERNYRE